MRHPHQFASESMTPTGHESLRDKAGAATRRRPEQPRLRRRRRRGRDGTRQQLHGCACSLHGSTPLPAIDRDKYEQGAPAAEIKSDCEFSTRNRSAANTEESKLPDRDFCGSALLIAENKTRRTGGPECKTAPARGLAHARERLLLYAAS